MTTIRNNAFDECMSLHELSLPASVTELAYSVFINGTPLDKLKLASTVPPSITESTFETYATKITVPKGSGDIYRGHEIWGRFANITEEE